VTILEQHTVEKAIICGALISKSPVKDCAESSECHALEENLNKSVHFNYMHQHNIRLNVLRNLRKVVRSV